MRGSCHWQLTFNFNNIHHSCHHTHPIVSECGDRLWRCGTRPPQPRQRSRAWRACSRMGGLGTGSRVLWWEESRRWWPAQIYFNIWNISIFQYKNLKYFNIQVVASARHSFPGTYRTPAPTGLAPPEKKVGWELKHSELKRLLWESLYWGSEQYMLFLKRGCD